MFIRFTFTFWIGCVVTVHRMIFTSSSFSFTIITTIFFQSFSIINNYEH